MNAHGIAHKYGDHVDSEVYLASPAVAAASGVMGHICHPEEVVNK